MNETTGTILGKAKLGILIYAFAILVFSFLWFCGAKDASVRVTVISDEPCIGAVLFNGEQHLGKFGKGVVKRGSAESKVGELFGKADFSVPRGISVIRVVRNDGSEFSKELTFSSEAYLHIDCAKGTIRGGN